MRAPRRRDRQPPADCPHSGTAPREGALLGFANFADLVLEDRMAHTGDRALAFLEDLKRKTERRFHEENQELLEFRRSIEGPMRPSCSPGTSPITPRSSAPRSTISTKRRCAPTSRWSAWWPALFDLVQPPVRHPRGGGSRRAGLGPAGAVLQRCTTRTATFLGGFYADWYPAREQARRRLDGRA